MSRQTDIRRLIRNRARRLKKLKGRQARKGQDAEPDLLIEIKNLEAQLAQLRAELATSPDIGLSSSAIRGDNLSNKTNIVGIEFSGIEGSQINAGDIRADVNITHIYKKEIHYPQNPPMFGRPFQAPPLSAHFIPRPEITNAVKTRLLADSPITPGVLVVSAIHGLGGIGKSTLAQALAYDEDVQERFKDGVLWVTLGQQPDLLSLLNVWLQALVTDRSFSPTTVEATTIHLCTLLQDKAVLLVVDDVWDSEHAKPFQVGGPKGQVLITTRRADVAEELGAALYQMDVMTPEQSLALLSARLERTLSEVEQGEALALAKDVGYLPLALELAAARVARDTTLTALRKALEAEVVRLEALEHPRRRRGGAKLEACFNLSLNALRTEDEAIWQAFIWLGILPEDAQIVAPMVAIL